MAEPGPSAAELLMPPSPPWVLRGRLLTPLAAGGTRFEPDAALVVDEAGRIAFAGPWAERPEAAAPDGGEVVATLDLRPLVLLPGLVDLHAHLPQLPNAGLGAGLDLLAWLRRYIFPLEQRYDVAAAEQLAPRAFRAFARAGTTTAVIYGAIWADSLDVTFRAAEAHGIRALIGKVMMDRITYDLEIAPRKILDVSLRESAELCERWHGQDRGRLRYAVTPRFAVSCTADMLRESARLAAATGAYWQTHLSEDRGEVAEVRRLFPEALDYVDVYDRAGGLGERSLFAHAIHLSDREIARLTQTGSRIAHCPSSNAFLASGVMPLARYLEAGLSIGLGSDVAAGPGLSLFDVMRAGADVQSALRSTAGESRAALTPLDWLRLGSLAGARALGIDAETGSLEPGKDADVIAIDAGLTAPLPGLEVDEPHDLMSRLVYRAHPDMVRGAWVRGRLLDASP